MAGLLPLIAFLFAGQADTTPCTPEIATRVSVEQVAADPRGWLDRCVTVSGPVWINGLYSSAAGFYLIDHRDEAGRRGRHNWRHRLGLYWAGNNLPDRAEPLVITGVVDSCQRIGDAARRHTEEDMRRPRTGDDDAITIYVPGGYCHSNGGAVVHVRSAVAGPPERFDRLVGPNARDQYGSLFPAPRDWPYFSRLERRANDLASALQTGDRARMSTLFGRFGARREQLDYIFVDRDSPFRSLRRSGRVQHVILTELFDYFGRRIDERGRTQDSYVCFCREGDCSRLWPIHPIDALHASDHPYACLQIFQDGDAQVFVYLEHEAGPLSEPASSARLAD